MDLGLSGRSAIVCGASAGLGRGVAMALAREGVSVCIAARGEGRLKETAAMIAETAVGQVQAVRADVTTEEGRQALLDACPEPDILINNAGGPPPGDFRAWSRDDWVAALEANMLSAIFLMRATVDGMIARKFGRIVNITSIMVKQPGATMGLSNGARAGLTGFVGGLAREVAAHNVTINNLLPGQFDTDKLQSIHRRASDAQKLDYEQFRDAARAQIPAGRFGTAEEFGEMCAVLCSAHAGYMTGQNILLDGGQYPGLI